MAGDQENVVSGELIEASWGNAIRDRVISRFATEAARNTAMASPDDGQIVYIEDIDEYQVRLDGAWEPLFTPAGNIYMNRASDPASSIDGSIVGKTFQIVDRGNPATMIAHNFYYNGITGHTSDEVGGSDDAAAVELAGSAIRFLAESAYDPSTDLDPEEFAILDPDLYDIGGDGALKRNLRVIFFGTALDTDGVRDGDMFLVHGADRGLYLREGGGWERINNRPLHNFSGAVGLTIASGSITPTDSYSTISPESGSSDSLTAINGATGDLVVLRLASSADTITIVHSSTLALTGSVNAVLSSSRDTITFIGITTNTFVEVARSIK